MRRERPLSGVRRGAGLALLTVLAAVAGAISGFVHRSSVEVVGMSIPVGLLAGWAAVTGLVLAARVVGGNRAAVLLVGAAYSLPVLLLSQFRPEGDLVVAEDMWGLSLLAGTAVVVTAGVTVPFAPYSGTTRGTDAVPPSRDDHQPYEGP